MAKKPDKAAPPALRTAVLVLGMHRSGTSALARIVNLLGAAAPAHLMPGDPSNPKGHWESQPLVDLHDQLLAALDSSWDDWRTPGARWKDSDAAARFAGRVRLAIDEEYGNAPLFVMKDPRLCRTLPYWMSILEKSGIRSAPLIVIRNPIEVAASLAARDGFSFEKSMLLWLRHNLDAEYETRHLQRNIVTFDALLENWKLLAVQSAARMGIAWPRQPGDVAADVREFLADELHRHRTTQAELDAHTDAPHWVKAAYRALTLLCDEPKSAEPKRELDRVRHAFAESAKIFGGVAFAQTDQLKQAALDVAAATARAAEFERVSHDFETALTQLKVEAKEAGTAAEDHLRRAEEADRRVAQLAKELAALERRRTQAQQALTRVSEDAGELKSIAQHLSDRTEWIEGELKAQHAKSAKMASELDEARTQALSLSTALQEALAKTVTLTQELTATKEQIHLHETRALKAAAEARKHQDALQTARKRIAEIEADERAAQAEVAELRAELAAAWARREDIQSETAVEPAQVVLIAEVGQPPAAPAAEGSNHASHEAVSVVTHIAQDLHLERAHVERREHRLTTWMGLASAALRKLTHLGGGSSADGHAPRKPPEPRRLGAPTAASRS